jgi:hypothetical protein
VLAAREVKESAAYVLRRALLVSLCLVGKACQQFTKRNILRRLIAKGERLGGPNKRLACLSSLFRHGWVKATRQIRASSGRWLDAVMELEPANGEETASSILLRCPLSIIVPSARSLRFAHLLVLPSSFSQYRTLTVACTVATQ